MADERFTATEALETLESQPADQAALYDAVRTVKYSQICNTFIVEDSEKTHGFEDSHALIEDMMRLLLATLPRHDVWSDELEQGNYNLDVVRDSRDVYLALIRDLENLTDEERADTATRRQIHERIAKDHLKVQGLLRPHLHRVRRISTRGRALQPTEMFAFLNGAIHDLELGTEKVYRLFDTSAFPSTLSALTDQVEEASQEASDVRGEARGLQDRVEHIGNLLNDHSGNVDTAQKKLDKFLDKARDDIADFAKDRAMKVTVDLYTSVFQRLADKHLAASVLIGLGGVGLGIWAFLFMQTFIGEIAGIEQVTAGAVLQKLATKGIGLSFLFYLLYQVVKNFNAQMHLYVMNRHRQNALNTFEVFYKQAEGDETRDAVLLAATRAIFDSRDSGYITKGRSEAPNAIEVINRLLGVRTPPTG